MNCKQCDNLAWSRGLCAACAALAKSNKSTRLRKTIPMQTCQVCKLTLQHKKTSWRTLSKGIVFVDEFGLRWNKKRCGTCIARILKKRKTRKRKEKKDFNYGW